ncbi:AraC family transcriptional regulator [Granulosicoccus sp. 3-233]|uniref:AraC family transcriptional regulator n=1 Tax=Granulosicoccus sp. 3-233 TaxID=3417969 RepID=UPI003D34E96B
MSTGLYSPIAPELEPRDVDDRSVLAFCHGLPSPLVRWHGHDEYELHLIVEGNGQMFVGDHAGPFTARHLIMLGPMQPHNWVSDVAPEQTLELRDFVVQFRRDLVASMAANIPEVNALLPLLKRSQLGLEFSESLGNKAMTFFERMIESDQITRLALLIDFLGVLNRESRYRVLCDSMPESKQNEAARSRIDQITSYIAANHTQDLRLSEVSRVSGMSESAFSRFFTRSTGTNFNRYLNRLRITHACELLGEGKLAITDVCHEVGFHNIANFNRHFRELKSMTPREYRKLVQQRYSSPAND